MRRRLSCMALVLAVGMTLMPSTAAMAAHKAKSPEHVKAAEARIEAAKQRIEFLEQLHAVGAATLEETLNAYHPWIVANRECLEDPERLVRASQVYRDRMAILADLIEKRFQKGNASQKQVLDARYTLAEAEYWLQDAKWKTTTNGHD